MTEIKTLDEFVAEFERRAQNIVSSALPIAKKKQELTRLLNAFKEFLD